MHKKHSTLQKQEQVAHIFCCNVCNPLLLTSALSAQGFTISCFQLGQLDPRPPSFPPCQNCHHFSSGRLLYIQPNVMFAKLRGHSLRSSDFLSSPLPFSFAILSKYFLMKSLEGMSLFSRLMKPHKTRECLAANTGL